nr:MAG TPA: hypothetical protein [Caudoviricetes sp.]
MPQTHLRLLTNIRQMFLQFYFFLYLCSAFNDK